MQGVTPVPLLRIDSWLFRARFYKSRSLAVTAVTGGRVHVNGARVKGARTVKPGDELTLSHPMGHYRIRVLAIPARREPAAVAAAHYAVLEFVPVQTRRKKGAAHATAAPPGRPDKHGRRKLRIMKGKE